MDKQSPQLLTVFAGAPAGQEYRGQRVHDAVVSAYPADFWVNIEMGNASSISPNRWRRSAFTAPPSRLSSNAFSPLRPRRSVSRSETLDEAVAEYEQALALDPENAWCHNRLGYALSWKGGRDDEAITHAREAVRLNPNDGWFHYCLGFALDRKDSLNEAIAELLEATRLLPQKRTEWMRPTMVLAATRAGRWGEATGSRS